MSYNSLYELPHKPAWISLEDSAEAHSKPGPDMSQHYISVGLARTHTIQCVYMSAGWQVISDRLSSQTHRDDKGQGYPLRKFWLNLKL